LRKPAFNVSHALCDLLLPSLVQIFVRAQAGHQHLCESLALIRCEFQGFFGQGFEMRIHAEDCNSVAPSSLDLSGQAVAAVLEEGGALAQALQVGVQRR